MTDTCYILDLSSMMWRAWHVAKRAEVVPSFIFCRMLLAMLKEDHPRYVIAAEDCSSSRVFRQKIYPDYKNKPRDPEEMKGFLVFEVEIKRILDVMMIPRTHYPGYEADDVVASLVHQFSPVPEGFAIVIATSDKDLYQLIGPRVRLYDLSSKKLLDAQGAEEAKGFVPAQTSNVLALAGDASDNIPGVPGVGVKTAMKLLREYGTLCGIFKHLEELTPKLRQNLSECRDQVFIAQKLTYLQTVPVPTGLLPLEFDESWKERVADLFRELGFGREIIGDLYVHL